MKPRSAFRKKLSAIRKATDAYRAFVGGTFPTLRALWFLAPRLNHMGRLVYFAPAKANPQYLLRQVMALLGYRATDDPSDPAVLSFKWMDDTYPVATDDILALAAHRRVLNVGTTDISKTRVSQLMQQIFGYTANVDPTQFEGAAVKKANQNAMEKESIVDCPIAPEEVDPAAVYQEVLGTVVDGRIQEHRITWVDGEIAAAAERLRVPERRFLYDGARIAVVQPMEIYSPREILQISRFAREMKLDFGDMETMRDSRGRLHILDVNPTAWSRLMGKDPTAGGPALVLIAKALERVVSREVPRR